MGAAFGFLIRDGLDSDIAACLSLDHHYETDFVWQMTVTEDALGWQMAFRTQRLPRTLEAAVPASEHRLKLALAPDQCFLVASSKADGSVLGYLTMRSDPVYRAALVQDLVVSRPFRRRRIGTRLLNIARAWAAERELRQFTLETFTGNYPGIAFCKAAGLTFCGFNDQYLPTQDIAVFFGQPLR
jgi:GNAT superfamily N-acetyltransferase